MSEQSVQQGTAKMTGKTERAAAAAVAFAEAELTEARLQERFAMSAGDRQGRQAAALAVAAKTTALARARLAGAETGRYLYWACPGPVDDPFDDPAARCLEVVRGWYADGAFWSEYGTCRACGMTTRAGDMRLTRIEVYEAEALVREQHQDELAVGYDAWEERFGV